MSIAERRTSRSTNASVTGGATTANDQTTLFSTNSEFNNNNCSCPCWNIIDGATTVGIWTFVLGIADMALFGWQTSEISVFGNRFPGRQELVYQRQEEIFYLSLYFVQITHLVADCFLTMASVAFIWGVQKRSRYLLWPWYPALLFNIVCAVAWAMVWFIRGVESYWTLLCATQLCFVLVNIYCFIVGIDAYRYVKRHPEPPSSIRKAHQLKSSENLELSEKNVAALGRHSSGTGIKSIEDLLGLQSSPHKPVGINGKQFQMNMNGNVMYDTGIANQAFVGSPLISGYDSHPIFNSQTAPVMQPRMPLDGNIMQQYNLLNTSGNQQLLQHPQYQPRQQLANQIDPGNILHLADLSRPRRPSPIHRHRAASESGSRRTRRSRRSRRYHSSDSSDYSYDGAESYGYFYGDSSYFGKSASVGSGLSRSQRTASYRAPRRHDRRRRSDSDARGRIRATREAASEHSFATTYENNDESLDDSRSFRTRTTASRDSRRRSSRHRHHRDRNSNRDDRVYADDDTRSTRSSRRSGSHKSSGYHRSGEHLDDINRKNEHNLNCREAGSEHGSRRSKSSRHDRGHRSRHERQDPNVGLQQQPDLQQHQNFIQHQNSNMNFQNQTQSNPSNSNSTEIITHDLQQSHQQSFHSASTIPHQITPADAPVDLATNHDAINNLPEIYHSQMKPNLPNSFTFAQQSQSGNFSTSIPKSGATNDEKVILNSSNSMPNSSLSYHVYEDSTPSPNNTNEPISVQRRPTPATTDSDPGGHLPLSQGPPPGRWVSHSIPSKPLQSEMTYDPQQITQQYSNENDFDPVTAGHTVV